MDLIFEVLFQFIGEILLQVLFEYLVELGFRSLGEIFQTPRNAAVSTIGYALWGTIAGTISLLVFPSSLITGIGLRRLNIIITPLAVGAIVMLASWARSRKGQRAIKPNRFGYPFAFALAMTIVRYIGTK